MSDNIIRKMILMVMVLAILFSVAIPKVGAIPAANIPTIDEMGVVDSTANAEENAINNESGWACLLDCSGSMREKEEAIQKALATYSDIEFAYKAKFDEELVSWDMGYTHKDTDILSAIEAVSSMGYCHIVVITDGDQDPDVYEGLSDKENLDLHMMVVGDNRVEAWKTIRQIESRLGEGSNFKVYWDIPQGWEEETILLDEMSEEDPNVLPVEEKVVLDYMSMRERYELLDRMQGCFWLVALCIVGIFTCIALSILCGMVHYLCKHWERVRKAEAPYRDKAYATNADNNGGAGKESACCAGCTVNVNLPGGCCGKGTKTCETCNCNATGAIANANATDDSSDASTTDDSKVETQK